MISFFRRALSSWLVLGLLGLVLIAFVVTGVDPSMMGMTPATTSGGEKVAMVGRTAITDTEIDQRLRRAYQSAQREQPGLDYNTFIGGGAIDAAVEEMLTARALEAFGQKHGFAASKRLVDGEIAAIPAFRGPTGRFDAATMRGILDQQRLTEATLRAELGGEALRRQILLPIGAGVAVPAELVRPYASLLLEERQGMIGLVPTSAVGAGPAPTEAELAAFYKGRAASYAIPERRVIRYAVIGRENVADRAVATDAEIAADYRANAARYAARETRDLSQIVVDSQAKANAVAAALRAGTSPQAAAARAGVSVATLTGQTREALATLASPAVATAAFGAPQGGVTAPARSDFGWNVVRVDRITQIGGRTLAQARDEIAARLVAAKSDEALADLVARVEEAIAEGASLADVARDNRLPLVSTPPILATGASPDNPAYQLPPELGTLVRAAFQASPDEDPVVETVAEGQRYAVVAVANILPSAPRPLAEVRERVVADFQANRAAQRARATAVAILGKVNAGTPIATAFAQAGVRLPAPRAAGGRRMEIAQGGQPVPPPLAMMFSMAQGTAKILESPGKDGWFVVKLDRINPGDARAAPPLIEGTRRELAQVVGQEYMEQFARAVRTELGASTDPAAIARMRAQLTGAGAQ